MCGFLQGDWGTQFGMLIQHIDESRPGGLSGGGGTTVEAVGDLQVGLQPHCMYFAQNALYCHMSYIFSVVLYSSLYCTLVEEFQYPPGKGSPVRGT